MWDNTTTSNGSLDKGIKLLVSSDSQLEMSWSNSLHFKIFGCITCKFENFSSKVLQNSSAVHGRGSSNSGVGTNSALQESVDSSDWELIIVNKKDE